MRALIASVTACGLLTTTIPAAGSAQDAGDVIAYLALNATPPGSFAPIVTRPMLADRREGWDFVPRFGRVDLFDDAANNFAVSFLRGGGRGSFGFTLGYWNPDCDGCDGHFVAGLGGDARLVANQLGAGPGAMLLTIGLGGELGFGKPEDATLWSAAATLPIALVAGADAGLRIVPFVTPGFGYGAIAAEGQSESGTRPLLGGGFGVFGGTGFGVTIGFQKVFIEDGRTTLGINASIRL